MNNPFKEMTNAEYVAWCRGARLASEAERENPSAKLDYGYGVGVLFLTRDNLKDLLEGHILHSHCCEEYGLLVALKELESSE
jgi:hypothetical protein